MKVILDSAMCTGHGRCYNLAPEVFSADDEGHSLLIQQDVPESLRAQAVVGEQNCPEHAIRVED